jgi:hypothetical protein
LKMIEKWNWELPRYMLWNNSSTLLNLTQ